ncbi:MAG: methyltransferase domain-containing protein [Actinomycetota bacterium]
MPSGRSEFTRVLRREVSRRHVDPSSRVLVLGGSDGDVASLRAVGLTDITLSNIEGGIEDEDRELGVKVVAADAEDLDLPDDSYDVVFVHAVLHHCRSPHKALCEMMRVAKQHVVFLEPNDSAGTRTLTRLKLSYPYEITAVVANDYQLGGVRNTVVPNFIYRWNKNEVAKTAATFLAEYEIAIEAHPYWDFEVDEEELMRRTKTRIPALVGRLGPRRMLRILAGIQAFLNRIRPLRVQGNKFFCWIEKTPRLKPWLTRSADGSIEFNREYQA